MEDRGSSLRTDSRGSPAAVPVRRQLHEAGPVSVPGRRAPRARLALPAIGVGGATGPGQTLSVRVALGRIVFRLPEPWRCGETGSASESEADGLLSGRAGLAAR